MSQQLQEELGVLVGLASSTSQRPFVDELLADRSQLCVTESNVVRSHLAQRDIACLSWIAPANAYRLCEVIRAVYVG